VGLFVAFKAWSGWPGGDSVARAQGGRESKIDAGKRSAEPEPTEVKKAPEKAPEKPPDKPPPDRKEPDPVVERPVRRNRPQFDAPVAVERLDRETTNSVKMKLVLIKPGTFVMGAPTDDYHTKDQPPHQVTLTRPFYIGTHEVTRGQFRAFVEDRAYHGGQNYRTEAERDGKGSSGYYATTKEFVQQHKRFTWENTGFDQTDEHPVVSVSWNDAIDFCRWLSKKEGKFYDLPTEAEWEYTCRAGTKTPFWTGTTVEGLRSVANLEDDSLDKMRPRRIFIDIYNDGYPFTAPVGKFPPNPWGLYDIYGNAAEWCADSRREYKPEDVTDPEGVDGWNRVVRGGHWGINYASSTAREMAFAPSHRSYQIGFRVVMRPGAKLP
jgi:formylglycine-generating enzyme required for sulfatase activity